MATRTRPFDSFGPYILFKKIEEHALGDVWRAGKPHGPSIRPVALHRLTGGNSDALRQSVASARAVTPQITGTSVVKDQIIELIEGKPVIEHEYGGGRTLRHILLKARDGSTSRPISPEQALAIAEKVTASIELVHNFRREGVPAVHGAVIPHFVWVEPDGEIQTAGQQLGKGLIASLSDAAVASEISCYIAPEVRGFGEPSAAGDIYSAGAILYLVLTGEDPPDGAKAAAFTQAMGRASLMTGEPIPPDIRNILQRALSPDINGRYSSAAELRKDLGVLIHSGAYSPTTFNFAFYLHGLLKKELQSETAERERELKVSPKMYAASYPAPSFHANVLVMAATPRRRSRLPVIAVGLALLAASGLGAWWVMVRGWGEPLAEAASGQRSRRLAPEIITAVGSESHEIAGAQREAAANAEEERKKRIEQEVQRRVEAEMMKLQVAYERELEARKVVAERREPELATSTAGFIRREIEPTVTAVASIAEPPPITTATIPTTTQATAPTSPLEQPVNFEPEIREGDLVGLDQVDQPPTPRSPIRPVYPPIALRQRLEGTVYVTALISETGRVLEVKVLRADSRKVGFEESAIRAVRSATFHPAIKDGKRVRTWYPIPIRFQP